MRPEKKNHTSSAARQPPEFLAVGRIVRPHGVRGSLLVERVSSLIMSIQSGTDVFLGEDHHSFKVLDFSAHRKRHLLSLEYVNTREDAEELRDQILYLRFEETTPLPEGEYYYWQLLGMEVISEEGEILGNLVEIIETGANDVYVIRSPTEGDLLLPAIESVIVNVDLEHNQMVVHLLPGLRTATSSSRGPKLAT